MISLKAIFYISLVVIIFGLGMYIGNPLEDEPEPAPPETIQVEKERPDFDLNEALDFTPLTVTEYDTITKTETKKVYMPVPTDMTVRGILPQNYLEINDNQFSVTYFDPGNPNRFRTETYSISPDTRRLELGALASATPKSLFTGPYLGYEAKRWEVNVSYGIAFDDEGYYTTPLVGLKISPLGYSF